MLRSILPCAAMLALPASAALAAPAVTVGEAWCRAAPTAAPAAACYLTLTADAADRLTAVESPAGARSEIHTMSLEGGVMRMRKLPDGLPLPAGKAVVLRPGAEHLMIIAPKEAFRAGATIGLTLRFEKTPPLKLSVPVRVSAP